MCNKFKTLFRYNIKKKIMGRNRITLVSNKKFYTGTKRKYKYKRLLVKYYYVTYF